MSIKPPKRVIYREPQPTAWLWILAVVILAAAGGLVYFLRQQPHDPAIGPRIRFVIAAAAICSGICVISAVSWNRLKR